MNKFWPVGGDFQTASTGSVRNVLPAGGPIIRVARETSSIRVWIKFGDSSVTADATGLELVSGIVEELENPDPAKYTYYAVITGSGTCGINITAGPRYSIA